MHFRFIATVHRFLGLLQFLRSSARCPRCPWCGCCLPVPWPPSVYPGALWGVLAVHGVGAAYLFLCFLQCTQELCKVPSLSMVWVLLTCSLASFSVSRSSARCPRCPWCGCCLPVLWPPSVYPGALWGVLAVHGVGAAYLFFGLLQCTQELCEVSSLSMVWVLLTCSLASFSVPRSSVRCPRCPWCGCCLPVLWPPSVYRGALLRVLAVHGVGAAYLFFGLLQCTQELCEVSSLSMVRVLLTCSLASFSVSRSSVRCSCCPWCGCCLPVPWPPSVYPGALWGALAVGVHCPWCQWHSGLVPVPSLSLLLLLPINWW